MSWIIETFCKHQMEIVSSVESENIVSKIVSGFEDSFYKKPMNQVTVKKVSETIICKKCGKVVITNKTV